MEVDRFQLRKQSKGMKQSSKCLRKQIGAECYFRFNRRNKITVFQGENRPYKI